jgi:hypothetical protein
MVGVEEITILLDAERDLDNATSRDGGDEETV